MIQSTDPQLQHFGAMAYEMHEAVQEKGHQVTRAMNVDPCFSSGQARAGLRRDVLREAACRVASQVGIDFRRIGEGTEFRTLGKDYVYRCFRLRSASRDRDGEIVIQHNSQSALLPEDESTDDVLLGPREVWVLGFIQPSDQTLDEVFLAKVVGIAEGKPGHLVLASIIPLLVPTTPPDDFEPDDEDLVLPEDDDEDDASGTAAA